MQPISSKNSTSIWQRNPGFAEFQMYAVTVTRNKFSNATSTQNDISISNAFTVISNSNLCLMVGRVGPYLVIYVLGLFAEAGTLVALLALDVS